MLRSMTAYVSTNHNHKGYSISCDIKSVNGKSLDINFKSNFILPKLELAIRELISKKVHRGNIEINFNAETIAQPSFVLNEKLIKEIFYQNKLKYIINRFGVIAGPWQFGKQDQGFIPLWVAKHFLKKKLNYIGFGSEGHQVRDIIHIDDVCEIIFLLACISKR